MADPKKRVTRPGRGDPVVFKIIVRDGTGVPEIVGPGRERSSGETGARILCRTRPVDIFI